MKVDLFDVEQLVTTYHMVENFILAWLGNVHLTIFLDSFNYGLQGPEVMLR